MSLQHNKFRQYYNELGCSVIHFKKKQLKTTIENWNKYSIILKFFPMAVISVCRCIIHHYNFSYGCKFVYVSVPMVFATVGY